MILNVNLGTTVRNYYTVICSLQSAGRFEACCARNAPSSGFLLSVEDGVAWAPPCVNCAHPVAAYPSILAGCADQNVLGAAVVYLFGSRGGGSAVDMGWARVRAALGAARCP